MVVDIFLLACFFPKPLHSLQGSVICCPEPPHPGQVCCIVKNPWLVLTFPLPPQVEQVLGLEPGSAPCPLHLVQLSEAEKLISCFFP